MIEVRILVFASLIAFLNPPIGFAQKPFKDFLGMPGALVKHPYSNTSLPLTAQCILELRDNGEIPVWFAAHVQEAFCLSGNCRPLNLWLFWDGIGEYLGFQLYQGEPLTKIDHNKFQQEDYEKLDRLLADYSSPLRDMKYESLTSTQDKKSKRIDTYSGATRPSLREHLVEDAAYTSYILWHLVHGQIKEQIRKILDARVSEPYLRELFDQTDTKYRLWAIRSIKGHPEFHDAFIQTITDQIQNDDNVLSKEALNYFEADQLSQFEIQTKLVSSFDKFPDQRQYELLWKLDGAKIYNETIVILLEMFVRDKIKVDLLAYIYDLIRPPNLTNKRITELLEELLNHENLYVRKITRRISDY